MARAFSSVVEFLAHGFDELIDVRSPGEFAEDHVPGAISLPVLSDAERATVGTIYVQDSAFRARKIGAALVARNAAAHLEGPLSDRDGGWRPLVYCWRGGQRSGSFATILAQVGWRAETVEGGYRSWRRLVQRSLYEERLPHRLVLLDGLTGTAKTELLHRLARQGIQVLDLERLAGHRGSLLGAMPGGQPSQKAFESRLAEALARFDPSRPVLAEAESSKVGRIALPPSLWSAMQTAARIEVTAPLDARARYLAQVYADLAADRERLEALLLQLVPLRGRAAFERWTTLLRGGETKGLAAALMTDHYDPAYLRSRAQHVARITSRVSVGGMTDPELERAVELIIETVSAP